MNFKKLKRKLRKIFLSLLFFWCFKVNLVQSVPIPGAEAFEQIHIINPKKTTYSREATNLNIFLQKNPDDQNRPRENRNKYNRYLPKFNCTLTDSQIEAKFKHAEAFGIGGNRNRDNIELFKDKIIEHLTDPATQVKDGTFRKNIEVTHFYNKDTGLDVLLNRTDNTFLSAWKLEEKQLKHVIEKGSL